METELDCVGFDFAQQELYNGILPDMIHRVKRTGTPIILQRVIPHYRHPFFQAVNQRFGWRVVAAAKPPVGTFLNLHDPVNLDYAEPFPMDFSNDGSRCYMDVNALIHEFRPPAILAEFSMRMNSSYLLPLYRLTRGSYKLAFWTQGWSMERPFRSPTDLLSQFGRLPLLRAADRILTYSEEGADWLHRYIPHNRVLSLGNTIDVSPVRELASKTKANRNKGYPSLISVGRLTHDKGVARLLDIYAKLLRKYPDCTLTIIGDGPERLSLGRKAELISRGNVTFTGPLYDEASLAPHFLAADVFVLAGAAGLSVNHSLAYGLPVVAFPRGRGGPFHHPEIEYVVTDKTGHLAKDQSDESLMDSIELTLSRSKSEWKSRIETFVNDKITIARLVEKFGRFHEQLFHDSQQPKFSTSDGKSSHRNK